MDQDKVVANLAAVESHFHSEEVNEVEKALDLYTDDIIWEAPARGIRIVGKEAVAANYRKMFASERDVVFIANLQRFATEDRVVDDSISQMTIIGPDSMPVPIGQKIEMRLVHIFEMRDGKICRESGYEMWKNI